MRRLRYMRCVVCILSDSLQRPFLQYNSGGIGGSEHKTSPLAPKFRDAQHNSCFLELLYSNY